jgi:Sulfotransferase family
MSTFDPFSPIVFLHMPKAAGSTMMQIIQRTYAGRAVQYIRGSPEDISAFVASPEAERHAVDVVAGHLYYRVRDSLRQPCTVVTMLRDPVDRALSLYHYVRREPKHRLHDAMRDTPLSEFIESRQLPELDNDHVRRLADVPPAEIPIGHLTQQHLDLALTRLKRDDVVFGLSERFEESIALISAALNWRPVSYESVNVAPAARDEIPPDVRDRIRERNRYDDALYRVAAGLFERRRATGAPTT